MEYGEFNSINTSLVEYERTTKRVPTMKSQGAAKNAANNEAQSTAIFTASAQDAEEVPANDNNGFFTPNDQIDFSKVAIEPLQKSRP